MTTFRYFWQGLTNDRSDWNGRRSRAYGVGQGAAILSLFVAMPALSIFALGVLVGLWWR